MQKLILVPRTRARTPNNRTTTGFRVSDALWAVLEPLLPVHVNTHRFGGGRPRVPDRRCDEAFDTQALPPCTASPPASLSYGDCHEPMQVEDAAREAGEEEAAHEMVGCDARFCRGLSAARISARLSHRPSV